MSLFHSKSTKPTLSVKEEKFQITYGPARTGFHIGPSNGLPYRPMYSWRSTRFASASAPPPSEVISTARGDWIASPPPQFEHRVAVPGGILICLASPSYSRDYSFFDPI